NLKKGRMRLGRHQEAQLLGSQLSLGLWGLYSSAMQNAGLIKGHERRLTQRGRQCVDFMLDAFGQENWQTFSALAQPGHIEREKLGELPTALRCMLLTSTLRRTV